MKKAVFFLTLIIVLIIVISNLSTIIPIPNQLNLQQITPTVIPTIIITPTPVITNLNSNDLNSAAYDINSPFVNVISRGSRQQSDGSGFYIRPNIVVTCAHILSFNNNTVNGNSVQILSINNSKDTALLKVSIRNNSYLSLSQEKLKQGQYIVTIGNPLGYNNTMSTGIISSVYRVLNNEKYSVFQFTAPVSKGSSGGAILNEKAEVIGMVKSCTEQGQNLNFAIPANQIQDELDKLK